MSCQSLKQARSGSKSSLLEFASLSSHEVRNERGEGEAQSLSYASLLAIINLSLGEVPTERSEEKMSEQLTLDLGDPFMGSK